MKYYKNREGILFPTIISALNHNCNFYFKCENGCPLYSYKYNSRCDDFATAHIEKVMKLFGLEKVKVEIKQKPKWISVENALPKPPKYMNVKRGIYLVRLSNNEKKVLAYEFPHYGNDIYPVGWHETAYPVTHWMEIPAFE